MAIKHWFLCLVLSFVPYSAHSSHLRVPANVDGSAAALVPSNGCAQSPCNTKIEPTVICEDRSEDPCDTASPDQAGVSDVAEDETMVPRTPGEAEKAEVEAATSAKKTVAEPVEVEESGEKAESSEDKVQVSTADAKIADDELDADDKEDIQKISAKVDKIQGYITKKQENQAEGGKKLKTRDINAQWQGLSDEETEEAEADSEGEAPSVKKEAKDVKPESKVMGADAAPTEEEGEEAEEDGKGEVLSVKKEAKDVNPESKVMGAEAAPNEEEGEGAEADEGEATTADADAGVDAAAAEESGKLDAEAKGDTAAAQVSPEAKGAEAEADEGKGDISKPWLAGIPDAAPADENSGGESESLPAEKDDEEEEEEVDESALYEAEMEEGESEGSRINRNGEYTD